MSNESITTKIGIDPEYAEYFNKYNVPERLKEITACIMKRFTINGLCDAMYICNVIAQENEIGDGMNNFHSDIISYPERAARCLRNAYGCNIFDEDLAELTEIIRNGMLNKEKAEAGIRKYIQKYMDEQKACKDDWRKEYLSHHIMAAKETLQMLNSKYDVVLCLKYHLDGLSIAEIQNMYSLLNGEQATPLEIYSEKREGTAIGFITDDAYSKLENDLVPLFYFIASILDNTEAETGTDMYLFDGISILMKCNFDTQD